MIFDTKQKLQTEFPEGTPVVIQEESKTGIGTYVKSKVVGTVVSWRYETTGAWYAQSGDPSIPNQDGKLRLLRLMLKKSDGEITDLVIDDLTKIAKLEAVTD